MEGNIPHTRDTADHNKEDSLEEGVPLEKAYQAGKYMEMYEEAVLVWGLGQETEPEVRSQWNEGNRNSVKVR